MGSEKKTVAGGVTIPRIANVFWEHFAKRDKIKNQVEAQIVSGFPFC